MIINHFNENLIKFQKVLKFSFTFFYSFQSEVDKILFEITAGELGKAPSAAVDSLIAPEQVAVSEIQAVDFEEMKMRLNSLKN